MTRKTYVSFGVQYHRETTEDHEASPHPLAPWADCDGYLLVVTPDDVDSRPYVNALLDQQFAFDYYEEPTVEHAPLGELAHLLVHEDGCSELVVHPWGEDAEPDAFLLGKPDVGK